MKLKGVNPFEQHIEKIVLMVMILLLLAVLAIQFVSRPNNIDVGGGRTVSPDQVYMVLEGEASRLEGQIRDTNPGLPDLEKVDLVERYNQAFESSSGTMHALSNPLGQGTMITQANAQSSERVSRQKSVRAIDVPQTSRPIAMSRWATLDPYALLEVPEYEEYIPQAQPFDFPSVSIEANFDGTALESILLGEEDALTMIPKRFWSANGIAILEFDVERQRLMPDGTWGESQPIERPPHTPIPTIAINEDAGLSQLTEVVRNAQSVMNEVVRPMFPPSIAGNMWVPPSELVIDEDESESTTISRLKRLLDRKNTELDRLRDPGSGRNPNPGKTGRDDRNTTQPRPRDNSDRIDRLEREVIDLEDQLKDLGVDLSEEDSRRRPADDNVESVLEEESIAIWAHDMGVEPGATYRYRTRVVINNPLFRKGGDLDADDEAQQALTESPFARADWSEWSDDVVVGASEYYFVTKADTTEQIGRSQSQATVEMYKMHYGFYRRTTLNAIPGDQIISDVRVSGNLLEFDTGMINSKDASTYVEGLQSEEKPALPVGIEELGNRIQIELGAFILDIYLGQGTIELAMGQEVTPMHVVIRELGGEVIVRSDVSDKTSSSYKLATESASQASKSELRAPGAPARSEAADLFKAPEP